MRNSVSISLPDGILKQLKNECEKENANGSEIIREALRAYFFRKEFSRLRRKAIIESAKRGITLTDEEIFKQVS
jgi:metal-responsive CopG/Arc/MetJ family transcriptional regulator